jgi:hypothetical protein
MDELGLDGLLVSNPHNRRYLQDHVPFRDLVNPLTLKTEVVLVAAGALMSFRTGWSLLRSRRTPPTQAGRRSRQAFSQSRRHAPPHVGLERLEK